jgi:hypothetical protein
MAAKKRKGVQRAGEDLASAYRRCLLHVSG